MNLHVKDLSVLLAKSEIVKNVSLCAENNEIVGILGPNGCGKSTLLKSIYKVLKPKSGTVFLGGHDVIQSRPKTIAKHMSVVGQFNDLSFDFTVQEVVMLGRTPHKSLMEQNTASDHEIVEKAIEMVDLAEFKDRSYSTLSGGEKQRVVLARAIAQQPKLLVLDEPTNHLDIKYQLQILRIVSNLKVGVLAALHDLALAMDFCDKVYIMKKGHIIDFGKPEEVLTEKLIKKVYGVDCDIYKNPINNKFTISYR